MVWHAGNNGLALLAGRWVLSMADFSVPQCAAAAAVLALSFWILRRSRRMADSPK